MAPGTTGSVPSHLPVLSPAKSPADADSNEAPQAPLPPQSSGREGQLRGGPKISVWLMASSPAKRPSELRPTSTSPAMGSTHANSRGFPV